jgi:hypothetical protein
LLNGAAVPKLIDYPTFAQKCRDQYVTQFQMSQARLVALAERALVLKSQVDDDFEEDDILRSQYVCLAMWLDIKTSTVEFNSEYSIFPDEMQQKVQALAKDTEDFNVFYNQCVDLFAHTEWELPPRNNDRSTRLRAIAFDIYLHGKTWAVVARDYGFQLSSFAYVSIVSILQRAQKTFKKIFRKQYVEFSQTPQTIKLQMVNQILMGLMLALGLYNMLKPAPKLPSKPIIMKTEALFGSCQMMHLVSCDFEEIDLELAHRIHSSFCFVCCDFCDRLRKRMGTITINYGDEASLMKTAVLVYDHARFEDCDEVISEGISSEPEKTQVNRKLRTEGLSSEPEKTQAARRVRTELSSEPEKTQSARQLKTESRKLLKLTSELAFDSNQQELIQCRVYRNLFRIYTKKGDVWKGVVHGLFVKGRSLLIPSHAIQTLKNSKTILLRNIYIDEGYEIDTSGISFYPITNSLGEEKDAAIATLPAGSVPAKVDIFKHFIKSKELSSLHSCRASIVALHDLDGKVIPTQFSSLKIRALDKQHYEHNEPDGAVRIFLLRQCYEYNSDTIKGDCGAPLIVSNPSVQRKILGIHVAGKDGSGVSNSISQEDLTRVFGSIPMRSQIALDLSLEIDETLIPTLPVGDFEPLGKLYRSLRTPLKTTIRKSPLYGLLDTPLMAPAVLSNFKVDGVWVDPLEKGLRKCGVQCAVIDSDILKAACTDYQQVMNSNTNIQHQRVLTYREGIEGVLGDSFLEPINRRSSPGWPWIDTRKGTLGKTKWLGDGEFDFDNVELRDAVTERLSLAKKGIRKPVFWIDTLKDERRSLAKVQQAKTRVFAAGSMDYILLFRQYFLGFNAHIMTNMIKNEIAVGINAYSTRWNDLAMYLKRKGNKVIAGDFSNFDGSLNGQILHAICDMINDWYDDGPENALIRHVLWEDISSSLHIFGDNVYGWTHSQPSGNPATVIINSLYNSISMRIVWCLLMQNSDHSSCAAFSRYVNLISFGDDNILNISDAVIDEFNQTTIAEGYRRIGMTYTDESKSVDVVAYRSLEEVSFLKRAFRWDNATFTYKAPLQMETIMEMCNWIRGDMDLEETVNVNVETALMELSLHPQQIFQEKSSQILRACRKCLEQQPKHSSYLEYCASSYDKNY